MPLLDPQQAFDLIRSSAPITQHGSDFVVVHMTYNSNMRVFDKRFSLYDTIGDVKSRAVTHFGSDADNFRVSIKRHGTTFMTNCPNSSTLLELDVRTGDEICFEASAAAARMIDEVTDVSRIKKYVMDDETYDARENTVREYKRKQREALIAQGLLQPEEPKDYPKFTGQVGDRCRTLLDGFNHNGVVRWFGEVPGLRPGQQWVGIELDEPFGRNDGTVKGVRLWECRAGHGLLVRVPDCEVGDFPVEGAKGGTADDLDAELAALEAELEDDGDKEKGAAAAE